MSGQPPLIGDGNLLIVDDFELNRDMLSRRLMARGFEVTSVGSGPEALDAIKGQNFDLVLLDIMMPEMDGYEVLGHIRKEYTSTDLAVIMVTARDQSEDVVKALSAGADDYIMKPIDFAVALARIGNQMSRRRTEIALRESEERYALAATGANDGLWDWDLRTHQVYYSDRWKTMIGFDPEEIGEDINEWFKRIHGDDLQRVRQHLDWHLKGQTPKFSCEYRMICKDGQLRWMLSRGIAVRNESVSFRMVGWQTDTTNRVQHDGLTQLPNRALFLERVQSAVTRAQREPNPAFAVLSIGVDRFKLINESLGHKTGDQILVKFVRRLEKMMRAGDTVARLGGDEFSMLIEDASSPAMVRVYAEKIRESLREPFAIDDQEVHITASIGIAMGDHRTTVPEDLLRWTHTALSQAKNRGKNTFEFFTSSNEVSTKLHMENLLRRALEKDELYLEYQPQVDTVSGRMVGVEALLRWRCQKLNPDRPVRPDQFIPLAEETDLILSIGEWVLRTACEQQCRWRDQGFGELRMGVNLSARQFRQDDFFQQVLLILDETGMNPTYLDLELTESLLMSNEERNTRTLQSFFERGIRVSIDDFGTGYSSLSYLKKFRIDTLKIDKSFVDELTENTDDAAIAEAIIRMAHSLRMTVIAEGVETKEQWAFLRDLQCDEMQGYLFSRPVAPDQIERQIKAGGQFSI